MLVDLFPRFFSFILTCVFPPFFKYHVVFQDQLEDYIGEDHMTDMIEAIKL